MPTTPLLPLPEGLEIISISKHANTVQIQVVSERAASLCPGCGTSSSSVHSHYRRRPLDLPCAGQSVRLTLLVRKFFCRQPDCQRKIFAERLPELLEPASRLTTRLRKAIQLIGFATSGETGARLAHRSGMPISATTLLRSLHLVPLPPVGKVRVVGLDDWAWRKGQRYGTIIIDQEKHQILDLLVDRDAKTAQKWLAAHPEIEVVSRDRGGNYIDAATWGAPQAVQVADRWHLLKNLGDAVEDFLVRARIRLPQEIVIPQVEEKSPLVIPRPPLVNPAQVRRSQAIAAKKWELIKRVKDLHAQGVSILKIVAETGLSRNTVRKYLRHPNESPPPATRPTRPSLLDPFETYLLKRFSQGCHNAGVLHREIVLQGFLGSNSLVKAYIHSLRPYVGAFPPPQRRQRAALSSPRELRWLLARPKDQLKDEEQARLGRLFSLSAELPVVYDLLQSFLKMEREKNHQYLRTWLEQARQSGVPEMKSFVMGIERDYDAVQAAIHLPFSQGQTEGQINKLKTIKRMLYGRAGFALLRQRLIHAL